MFDTLMGMIGFSGFGVGTVVTLGIGACIGWCIPQPAFVSPILELVCKRFGLERFHKDGHAHSDEHENAEHKED